MTLASNRTTAIDRTERGLVIAGTRITLYDVMDYLKADYPAKFIRDAFELTEGQVEAAIAYITDNKAEFEVEYQSILQGAEETREYWEDLNRDRMAQIAVAPPGPGYEAARIKLLERKALRAARAE
jgi:uncharacterized protein (DUF433 family)